MLSWSMLALPGKAAPACPAPSSALDLLGAPYPLTGDVCGVHDPCLARDQDGTYHVFSTDRGSDPAASGGYLPHRCSPDGLAWSRCGAVFAALPAWLPAAVPGVRGLWAPDVSFHAPTRQWHLYYAASTFGSQASALGLATSPRLTGAQWTDRGLVLASRPGDAFNAIDPSRSALSEELGLGSFWGGLFSVPLGALGGSGAGAGGGALPLQHLAQRPSPDALEGISLLHISGAGNASPAQATPWLLASFDLCCRGVNSTYNVRAGRAGTSGGAFVDQAGTPLLQGGGTLLVGGGHGWAAAGGQSPLRTADASAVYSASSLLPLALHAYDGATGEPYLHLLGLNFSGHWVAAQSWGGEGGQ